MKKILLIISLLAAIISCSGCNKQIFDTTYSFDRAQIIMPDGSIISGKVESWTDFDDGDQIQVKINGTTYLVHSENIVLIAE